MNANDSGNPFAPTTQGTEPAPVTAETPRRSAFRPINSTAAPTAAPAAAPAQRPATQSPSTFQWNATPSATQAPTAQSAPPATRPTPVAPPANPAPASGSDNGGAFSVGVDKVKGFAVRAKNSLTEGDDLTASNKRGGPRKARVLVSRIDPWSVLKMGFLLSIAAGIMMVVAVFVLWNALNSFGLFTLINEWVGKLFEGEQPIDITKIFELNKVMSATILVSVMNVVLLTALSTIAAFLYNTVSSVVGGVYVTLTDD
jgi:hypothetical protein